MEDSQCILTRIKSGAWKGVSRSTKSYCNKMARGGTIPESAGLYAVDLLKCVVESLKKEPDIDELYNTVLICYEFVMKAAKNFEIKIIAVDKLVFEILQYLAAKNTTYARQLSVLFRLNVEITMNSLDAAINKISRMHSNNCYLVFWNGALEEDKQFGHHSNAFQMRLEALRYYALDETACAEKFVKQARSAAEFMDVKSKAASQVNDRSAEYQVNDFYVEVFRVISRHMEKQVVLSSAYARYFLQLLISWIQLALKLDNLSDVRNAVSNARDALLAPHLTGSEDITENCVLCLNLLLLTLRFHSCQQSPTEPPTPALLEITLELLKASHAESELCPTIDAAFGVLQQRVTFAVDLVKPNETAKIQMWRHSLSLGKLLEAQIARKSLRIEIRSKNEPNTSNALDVNSVFSSLNQLMIFQYWALRYLETLGSEDLFAIFDWLSEVVTKRRNWLNKYSCSQAAACLKLLTSMRCVIAFGYKCNWPKIDSLLLPFTEQLKKIVMRYNALEETELGFKNISQNFNAILHGMDSAKLYCESLAWIAEFLAFQNEFHVPLFNRWMNVKRIVKDNKMKHIAEITVIDLVPKYAVLSNKASELITLAKKELEGYLKYPVYYKHECCTLLTKSLMIMTDPIDKISAWIELAKLQLMVSQDLSRSPQDCIKEAMKLIDNMSLTYKSPLLGFYAAQVYFLTCVIKFNAKMNPQQVDVTAAHSQSAQNAINDLVDEMDKCDVTIEYLHLTMHVENDLMAGLVSAIDVWTSTVNCNPDCIPNLPGFLVDLRMTAEMFAVKRLVFDEIRSWKLFIRIGRLLQNEVECAFGLARLVRLLARMGWTDKATEYLAATIPAQTSTASADKKSDLDNAQVALLLAKSELLLVTNKISEGWEVLRTAYDRVKDFSGGSSYSSRLLKCEAMLLASKYCELPNSILKRDHMVLSPIDWARQSYSNYYEVLKNAAHCDKLVASQMRYRVLGGIFESILRLGKLFHDIGAPREARCYLSSQLGWAKQMSLANWSAELLLLLARLDLISNNNADFDVKLNSVEFILQSEGSLKNVNADYSVDCATPGPCDTEDFKLCEPADPQKGLLPVLASSMAVAGTMSPIFNAQKGSKPPSWILDHEACEDCAKCRESVYAVLCLKLFLMRTECKRADNSNQGRLAAQKSLWETLKQARCLLEKEKHVALRILQLVDDQDKDSLKKTRSKRKPTAPKPILETEIYLCNGYCRLAQLCLECGDVGKAMEAIEACSGVIDALCGVGVGRAFKMKAFIKYLKATCTIMDASYTQRLPVDRLFDSAWMTSLVGYTSAAEVNCITELVELLKLESQREIVGGFKTPKWHCQVDSAIKLKSVGAIKPINLDRPAQILKVESQPQTALADCMAPVKKRAYMYAYEVDHRSPKPAASFPAKHETAIELVKPGDDDFESPTRPAVRTKASKRTSRKAAPLLTVLDHPTPRTTRCRKAKENITTFAVRTAENRTVSKKIRVYADVESTECSEDEDDSCSPRKRTAFSNARASRLKKELSDDLQPLSPIGNANTGSALTTVVKNDPGRTLVSASSMTMLGLDPNVFQVDSSPEIEQQAAPMPAKRVTRASARNGGMCESGRVPSKKTTVMRGSKSSTGKKWKGLAHFVLSPVVLPPIEIVRVPNRESLEDQAVASLELDTSSAFFCDSLARDRDRKFEFSRSSVYMDANSDFQLSTEVEDLDSSTELDKVICSEPSSELNLQNIIANLEEAVALIDHHPCVPLYGKLHGLLAMCKGEQHPDLAHHVTETMAVALRHTAALRFTAMYRKQKNCGVGEGANEFLRRNQAIDFQACQNTDKLVKSMPKDWTIVQVTVTSINEYVPANEKWRDFGIILTRFQRNCSPVSVKILNSNCSPSFEFSKELNSIFEENLFSKGEKDYRKWVEYRQVLDTKLKVLLVSMEQNLLGHWKGFMLGLPSEECCREQLDKVVSKLKKYLERRKLFNINECLLKVVVDSFEDLNLLQQNMAIASLCRLSLQNPLVLEICQEFKNAVKSLGCSLWQRQHLILVLDKSIQALPWENMPMLKNKSISRMPSIHFILSHLELFAASESLRERGCLQMDASKVSYVLNPNCDLQKTQERMAKLFDSWGWTGVSGRSPTAEEWSESLRNQDLFVYCGHGAGSKYLGGEAIQKLNCRACVLLFGCSSGALRYTGSVAEPYGTVHNYIIAGCPSVLGNLWDVTDNEIDKFSEGFIKRFISENDKIPSLNLACTVARSVCMFRYLTASAVVFYGFPVEAV